MGMARVSHQMVLGESSVLILTVEIAHLGGNANLNIDVPSVTNLAMGHSIVEKQTKMGDQLMELVVERQ